jgi:Importin-beta N-terminal domain
MALLSNEIANESSPAHVRQSAALALKNQLSAKVFLDRSGLLMLGTSAQGGVPSQVDRSRPGFEE